MFYKDHSASATALKHFRAARLDMRFDFRPKLLEVLYDRPIDCSAQIRVLIGDTPGLLSNRVVDVLSSQRLNISFYQPSLAC